MLHFQRDTRLYRLNVEQSEVNQMVATIVSVMVHDPRFVNAIKDKIGFAVDTSELERQMDAIKTQLRQRLSTKSRLEHQIDTLDFNDPYYDRKVLDLQRRYDEQYELIEDMESQLREIQGHMDKLSKTFSKRANYRGESVWAKFSYIGRRCV